VLAGAIAGLLGGNELRATGYKLEPEVGIAPVESRSLLPSPSMTGEGWDGGVNPQAAEEASNGLLLAGQVSGILFILGMDALKATPSGSMTLPLLTLAGLIAVALLLSTRLKESGALDRSP